MNIGEFNVRNDRLQGWIATNTIDLPRLGLRPVQSNHERAPVYEIIALNVGNRWVKLGALWDAVATRTTGEAFLQGSIDDPSLPEPLSIALFGTEQDGFRVAWRRPQRRDDFGPTTRPARSGYSADGEGGGFGDSTAGMSGGLAADETRDEEVPF